MFTCEIYKCYLYNISFFENTNTILIKYNQTHNIIPNHMGYIAKGDSISNWYRCFIFRIEIFIYTYLRILQNSFIFLASVGFQVKLNYWKVLTIHQLFIDRNIFCK